MELSEYQQQLIMHIEDYYTRLFEAEYPLLRLGKITCGLEDGAATLKSYIITTEADRDALIDEVEDMTDTTLVDTVEEAVELTPASKTAAEEATNAAVADSYPDLSETQSAALTEAVYVMAEK